MSESCCPQCSSELLKPACRLVQDACGHKKCRLCLLQDESQCRQCKQDELNCPLKDSVIKYENSHAPKLLNNGSAAVERRSELQRDLFSKAIGAPVLNGLLKNNGNGSDLNAAVGINSTEKQNKDVGTKIKGQLKREKRNYKTLIIPNHISVLKDPVSYRCNICSKVFVTKSHVKYHLYCKEGNKPLRCNDCNKEFINKSHLKIHSFIHAGTKPYTCNICKKSFSANSKLNRHKLSHGDTTPYICQECGKSFSSKDSLKIHLYVHSGKKPYRCSQCDAKFTNSSNLKKHQVTHTKDKVHMCDQCGKRFKLKWALTVHRKSHSHLRPHICNNCSKAFVNAKDLHRHQLIHIDLKAFSCGICRVGFRRKDNLERHMRNTHPGQQAKPIKNTIKPALLKNTLVTPVDNPNAIKVITASPARHTTSSSEVLRKTQNSLPFVNPPVKLAIKPSFRNNYNIKRDYMEPPKIYPKSFGPAESVIICQKILSPHSSPPHSSLVKPHDKNSHKDAADGPQVNSTSFRTSLSQETSYEHRKHINIKFKLPPEYINLRSDQFADVKPLQPVNKINSCETNFCDRANSTYTELKPVNVVNGATSVIVNGQNQQDMHWRRRTALNLNLQSKQ